MVSSQATTGYDTAEDLAVLINRQKLGERRAQIPLVKELIAAHDRALGTVTSLGVSTVRSIEPFGVHLLQGRVTRRSLRHNPLRWFVGLIAKTLAPDRPHRVEMGPALDRRVRLLRLA